MAIKLTPGNLYLIRDVDYLTNELGRYVKIGIVTNNRTTEQRKKEHQTGNPRGIFDEYEVTEVPFVERLETQLHYEHIDRWITGEWFLLNDIEAKAVYDRALFLKSEQLVRQKTIRKVLVDFGETPSSGVKVKANKKALDLETKYLQLKSDLNILAAQIDISKKALYDALGTNGAIEGVLRIGFTDATLAFDEAAFALANPKIYKSFMKSKPIKLSAKFTIDKTTTVSLAKVDPSLADQKKALDSMTFTKTQLGKRLTRTKAMEVLHWNHLQLLREEKIREYEMEMVQYEIQFMPAESTEIPGVLTIDQSTGSPTFNKKRFIAENPELVDKYQKVIPAKVSNKFSAAYKVNLKSADSALHKQVQELPKENHEFRIPNVQIDWTDELQSLHASYLDLDRELESVTWELNFIENKIKASIGDYAEVTGVATWKRAPGEEKTDLDTDAIKKHHLAIYENYLIPVASKWSVHISPFRAYPIEIEPLETKYPNLLIAL